MANRNYCRRMNGCRERRKYYFYSFWELLIKIITLIAGYDLIVFFSRASELRTCHLRIDHTVGTRNTLFARCHAIEWMIRTDESLRTLQIKLIQNHLHEMKNGNGQLSGIDLLHTHVRSALNWLGCVSSDRLDITAFLAFVARASNLC